MLTITNDQLEILATEHERMLCHVLMSCLRRELSTRIMAISEQELQMEVEQGIRAAKVLQIYNHDDVYRFLRLRYLPVSIWKRPGTQELLVRVLTDTSVDARRRLLFIQTNFETERYLKGAAV